MNNLFKRVELIANLSITIAAVLLSVVLVRSYLFPAAPAAPKPAPAPYMGDSQLQKGTKVSLPDVDWQKNGSTLLLALSTTCHFCTESAPFYKQLVKEHGRTRLIALVPQNADEGQLYLKKLGVEVDDVKQASPATIGISGTPTLILVDGDGKVANSWVGLLSEDGEKEVLSQLASEERASN